MPGVGQRDVWNAACLAANGTMRDSGAPDWCGARWCYVDAETCQRPMDPSDVQPGSAGSSLSYSYETCGNLNAYSEVRHYKTLRGQHLRVSYPSDSGSGYTLVTTADGRRLGADWAQIAREAQFTWEIAPLHEESRSMFASSFTACVHQVALGEADLCIANFWMTSARMLIHSGFTAPVYYMYDDFVLVVNAVEEADSFLEKVARPFTMTLTPMAGSGCWAIYGLRQPSHGLY